MILPLLPSSWGFCFALRCGVPFFGGIQRSPMPAKWENSAIATGLEKVSFHSNHKERQCKRMLKLPHNCTIATSHASKVMLKILQARLQQSMMMNFQMFKQDLEKAEEPEIKLLTSIGSLKKQESSRKTSTSALLTVSKSLTV